MNGQQDTSLQAYTHLLLEQAAVGIALFDARDLYLLAANERYHAFHQFTWQQASSVGRALTDMLPQAEHSSLVALFRHVVESGTAYRDEAFAVPIHETVYWNLTLDPLHEDQQVRYVILTVIEVTSHVAARKMAEKSYADLLQSHRAVEMERQRFYTILDQLPEGVLLIEAMTSKISYINLAAASLLGVAPSQVIGVPLNQSALTSLDRFARQDQKVAFRWNFALIHALWGQTTPNQELSITRPDGSEIIVLSSTAPIRAASGMITEAVIVFQDISTSKQIEQQKNEFFAVANHELRTPLTIITGFAEILQQIAPASEDPTFQSALTHITQEGHHLQTLVEELLNVSRLEQVRVRIKKSYQDLLAPLRQLVNRRNAAAYIHQLRLIIDNEQEISLLMGWFDVPRIEQALNNLITNAIKYSPSGGEVEVGVQAQSDSGQLQEVHLRITDHGIGIAANELPHIFKPFYRAETGDSTVGGFGIGLYLTKEIVLGHNGRIWVESTRGQGSTFFIALPLGDAHNTSHHI